MVARAKLLVSQGVSAELASTVNEGRAPEWEMYLERQAKIEPQF